MTSSLVRMQPRRGEVYDFDPDPVSGRELGMKVRPGVIISNDNFNRGASGLVIIVPTTSTIPPNHPLRITVHAPEGGFTKNSSICCDHVRSISVGRLKRYRGQVTPQTVSEIERRLRALLVL